VEERLLPSQITGRYRNALEHSKGEWKLWLQFHFFLYKEKQPATFMTGLDDLKGLFQPKWFYDSSKGYSD